jgi:hypothetical protein
MAASCPDFADEVQHVIAGGSDLGATLAVHTS